MRMICLPPPPPQQFPRQRLLLSTIRAAQTQTQFQKEEDSGDLLRFACSVCYQPLIRKGPLGFNVPAIYRSAFQCQTCNKSYSSKEFFLDLTVTSGTKDYMEFRPTRTELFRARAAYDSILRNEEGRVIFTLYGDGGMRSVLFQELKAIDMGLKQTFNLGYAKLVVALDSKIGI